MRSIAILILLPSLASAAPLRGNVLVPQGVPLHATAAAARADASPPASGAPVAMRMVREHAGDVVELTTAATEDCVESSAGDYVLTVFVKRDKLYQRTAAELVKTFPDGTAIAIDRGAPVMPDGAWLEPAFTAMKVAPPDKLVLAVTTKQAQLPPLAGESLVCDGGGPVSFEEYRARRGKRSDADLQAAEARAQQRAEQRREQREKERAETLAKRAKRKGPPTSKQRMQDDLEDLMYSPDDTTLGDTLEMSERIDMPPPCHVADRKAIINHRVVKDGKRYLADLGYHCGRVRVIVDHAQIGGGGRGGGLAIGEGARSGKVWTPRPGPVTWESGKPAGRFTGSARYRDVVEKDSRICVAIGDFAERVCHPKKTTAVD